MKCRFYLERIGVMDRYNARLHKMSIGDIFQLSGGIADRVKCVNYGRIKKGDNLYVIEDYNVFMDAEYMCHYKRLPKITVEVKDIKYKSWWNKLFKWFVNYPIESIDIEYIR